MSFDFCAEVPEIEYCLLCEKEKAKFVVFISVYNHWKIMFEEICLYFCASCHEVFNPDKFYRFEELK